MAQHLPAPHTHQYSSLTNMIYEGTQSGGSFFPSGGPFSTGPPLLMKQLGSESSGASFFGGH